MPWPTTPDDELFGLIDREVERQNTTVQLIASENFTSPAVLRATGSVLTNKYSEGYPGKRYYGGNEVIDQVEDLARERAKALFGAEHANVQPHSGANANMAVYFALLEPGDTVLGLRLDQGGHLTHGSPVNASGRLYHFVSYGVTPSDERIDLDQVRDLALEHRPKLIVTGATAYPRIIDPAPFRAIADEVGALFMFDAAHIAGLVAGGAHPNPVGSADIVTLTTHKTLRGPRGGAILSRAEIGEKIDKSVFPGLQGGPLDHVIAAKAVSFAEAATPEFGDYARQIVTNAAALAEAPGRDGPAPGVGRHRQPPHAGRPAQLRRRPVGEEGAPGARPRGHQPQREHGARRPPPAVHHERPAHRHARDHDSGHARARDGPDRGADPPGARGPRRRGRGRGRPRRGGGPLLQVRPLPDVMPTQGGRLR